jgi:hypothetical protein
MVRIGVLIVVIALAVLPAARAHRAAPTLFGVVGTNDGFDISLNDAAGKKISTLPPGTYDVVVDDRSRIHNFHLASNEDTTVDFRTDVDFVGRKTFTVTFKDGVEYAYACEPHWRSMNGSFLVTSAPAPPPPPPVRTLTGVVTASGAVSFARAAVPAGRYAITIRDRSRRDNFHLRGRAVDRRTGIRARGTVRWRVTLTAGSYRYGSDRTGLRRRLRVR